MQGVEQQGSHWRQISLLELVAALPAPPEPVPAPTPDPELHNALEPEAGEAAAAATHATSAAPAPDGSPQASAAATTDTSTDTPSNAAAAASTGPAAITDSAASTGPATSTGSAATTDSATTTSSVASMDLAATTNATAAPAEATVEARKQPAAAAAPEPGPDVRSVAATARPTSGRRRRSPSAGKARPAQPSCARSDSNSPDNGTNQRDGDNNSPADGISHTNSNSLANSNSPANSNSSTASNSHGHHTPAAGIRADPPGCGQPATREAATACPDTELPACPQQLLILDTETTGLSPEQGQCIELGAVLFDVASRAVLMQVSFLMPCDANPAQHVNGIPAAVSRLSQPWRSGLACFEAMVQGADAVLAHNAAFDRQWFGTGALPLLAKPWICSMEDIRWPAERQLRATPSVRDLALAYGVPVWAAHRALTDCIYLVQVFQRCHDLEALLQAALEPRRLVRARLSYDERQLAKDAGFRWNEPVPRAWSRRLSEREIAALPFPVDPVEADPAGEARRDGQGWRRSA